MRLIELGGKMFSAEAIDSITPGTRVGTTFVALRGGSANTIDVPYDAVRASLIRHGLLTTSISAD